MALVPGSLHIDIFVTNIPDVSTLMSPAGTVTEEQEPNSPSGSKLRQSWTPVEYPPTQHTPRVSQPLASMEDVSLCSEASVSTHTVPSEENLRRKRSRISVTDDYNTLLVPNPRIGPSSGRYEDGGLEGKGYKSEMGHSQEDSTYDVLDYTHFNGDLDAEVVPAEESLNKRLRLEGLFRRKKTRRLALGYTKPSPLSSLLGHGSRRGRGHSKPLTLNLSETTLTGKQARRASIPEYLQRYELGLSQQDPSKPTDKKAKRASLRDSLVDLSGVQSMMPKTGKGARGEEMEIQFSEEELEDVLAMAEYAWPGRPMLDKLLQEEVGVARGAIVVACECSPLSSSFFIPRSSDLDPTLVRFSQVAARHP